MTGFDKETVWREVLESIRVSVSSAIYSTWISQTHLISLRKVDTSRYIAEIGCNSSYVKGTVETRYFGLLQDALMKTIASPTDLTFVVDDIPTNQETITAPLFEERETTQEFLEKIVSARIRPHFTFKNFAVSASNQMAFAAAQAVAENPGVSYNPLFLWGGVGVGKTHLMHAVAHSLIMKDASAKMLAVTGEEFTNDIVEGIRNKTTQRFRDKYRKLSVLMIDDIQFIAGKDAVQDEFFHTFNAVVSSGGQIILTSDKPPSDIPKLEERLRSRFEAGLIVDIGAPDFELRCAIIQIKADEKGMFIPTDIVQLIAGNVETARKIEGFLMRLSSEVRLKNATVTEELVKSMLSKGVNLVEERVRHIVPDQAIDAVCTYYSINKRVMMGKVRSQTITMPRQVLMYLLRTELKLPLQEVGRLVGGRDHSTVMHAVDKITQLASSNVQIREDILRIKNAM